MLGAPALGLFFTAALILALTPGPGIFYVLTRSINGGRRAGIASALGTAVGGFSHVLAAALGLSAVIATSALAFSIVKWLGAAYLIYLGIRTLLSGDDNLPAGVAQPSGMRRTFLQGIMTEVLNPKTALFFLAFIPQFIDSRGWIVGQFVLLGCISVLLNTSVDFVVAALAGPIGQRLQESIRLRRGQRLFSGCGLIALGAYVAIAREK
ncbi:MAG TPA: LysE family translocator [Roseiflexaceae bacterium]|nr:LysE family translocator [Roseiflexaceae bacterium]